MTRLSLLKPNRHGLGWITGAALLCLSATAVQSAIFTNVTAASGINHVQAVGPQAGIADMTGGAAAGDVDGDGWIDLFVTRVDNTDILYKNIVDSRLQDISSISGFVGQEAVHPGYNASKGAVRLVTKAVAVQHAKSGIRVNSVHPGIMPPMLTSFQRGDANREALVQAVPMGREGQPIEVANAVLFLASDEASYITGTELLVDGGFTAK